MSGRTPGPLVSIGVLRLAACARASTDYRGTELLDAAAAEIERLARERTELVRRCDELIAIIDQMRSDLRPSREEPRR